MVFGSGCPEGSVNIVASTDGKTFAILFSSYFAQTSDSKTFDRKSCNIAVPFNIDPNKQVALMGIEYRGYSWIPDGNESETNLGVEYFFAGTKGPIVTRTFNEEEDIVISDKVPMVWSPCEDQKFFESIHQSRLKRKVRIMGMHSLQL